ncbi:MAG: PAS domain S-box protein [Methanomicrobiales archaeon]|nr:PAS domain S-box protein [Methanomicrobiales archaeon]
MNETGPTNQRQKISVLYVDDEQDLLMLCKIFLERTGEFTIETVSSAKKALTLIEQHTFDCIISDYLMPEMDGISFLKTVRELHGDIPFILFTGRGREDVVIEAINNGADFYLQKGGEPQAQFAELSHKIQQASRRRQAELSLQESEKKLSDIIGFLPDATFAIDKKGRIIAWNRAIEEMTGITSEIMIGKGDLEYAIPFYGEKRPLLIDLINEPDEKVAQYYSNIYRTGNSVTAQTNLPHPKGKQITTLIKVSNLYNQAGEITGAIESIRDITELSERIEEKKQLGDILDKSLNEIYIFDSDTLLFLYVNKGAITNLGFTLEELKEMTPLDIKPEFTDESFELKVTPLRNGKSDKIIFLTIHQRKDKTTYPVEVHLQIAEYGTKRVFIAIIMDITERKKTETALLDSESRLRSFIESAHESVIMIDEEGVIIEWNQGSENLSGIPKNEALGRYFWDIAYHLTTQSRQTPDYRNSIEKETKESLKTGKPFFTQTRTIEIERPDGSQVYASQSMFPIKSENGYKFGFVAYDCTSEKIYEENLKKSEEWFRGMTERSSDLIVVFNNEKKLVYVSPSARTIIDYDPDGLVGITLEDFAHTFFSASSEEFYHAMLRVMRGETFSNVNMVIRKKDTTPVYIDLVAIPVEQNGVVTSIQVSMRDITSTKNAETSLIKAEAKFHRFADNAQDMLYRMKFPEGTYEFISKASFSLTGYRPEDFYTDPGLLKSLIHPAWHKYFEEQWEASLNRKVSPIYEFQIIDRSGNIRWVNQRNVLVEGDDEHSFAVEGIVTDITGQKIAEQKLKESEEKFRIISEQSLDGLIITDYSGTILFVNPGFGRIIAHPRVMDLVGNEVVFSFFLPEYRDAAIQNFNQIKTVLDDSIDYYQLETVDKRIIWVECIGKTINFGGVPSIFIQIRDVTLRMQSEIPTRTLVKTMVGVSEKNSLEVISETICQFLGADGVMIGEITNEQDKIRVLSMYLDGEKQPDTCYSLQGTPCEQVIEKGISLYQDNTTKYFPDCENLKTLKIQGYIGAPLINSDGIVFGTICLLFRKPIKIDPVLSDIIEIIGIKISADIERDQIEKKLRENQNILSKAMDMAHLVHWEYDIEHDLFTFNDQFYTLYGTDAETEGGYQMSSEAYARKFIHPADVDMVSRETEKAIQATDTGYTTDLEHRIINRDGKVRYITVRIGIIKDDQGRTIRSYGVNQDITERKHAEEAVKRANHQLKLLSSITRHDIVNNLSIINAYLALGEMNTKDPEILEYFQNMKESTEKMQSQIEFTRVFQDIGFLEPTWIELESIMPQSSLPPSVTMVADIKGISVLADPMLEKVFFNLLDNSIRHGEHVTEIRVSARQLQQKLVIAWEDNGAGISQEDKELIFDRGFGRNTGFGMFLAKEILALTDIEISENGEPGSGARFLITVPEENYRLRISDTS